MSALSSHIIQQIHFCEASLEEVERTRQRVAALREGMQDAPPASPFFVVTPLGLAQRSQLLRLLADYQIQITQQTLVPDWATAATPIYVRTLDDERLRVALCFEALWRMAAPAQPAEIWQLTDIASYTRLTQVKYAIREALGSIQKFQLICPGVTIRTPGQIVRLQPLHVPDPEELKAEAYLLKQLSA